MEALETRPKLSQLQLLVKPHVAIRWEELGVSLGLADGDEGQLLDKIREDRNDDCGMCFNDAMKLWLRSESSHQVTWAVLIEVIKRMDGLEAVGAHIEAEVLSTVLSQPLESLSQPTKKTPELPINKCSYESNSDPLFSAVSVVDKMASLQITAPKDVHQIDYSFKLDPEKRIRDYQWELANPGINGENYIVVAPQGCGKTTVAALVISNHLSKNQHKSERPKVVFVVNTRNRAEQQLRALKQFIPGARVGCSMGDGGPIITDLLSHSDIVVSTAAKFLYSLIERKISFDQISLMIIDKCHHAKKGSPQANIMVRYLKSKAEDVSKVPQVMGLTESPGAGSILNLDEKKAIDHLVNLCSLMNATSGIKVVEDNIKELNHICSKPTFTLKILPSRSDDEPFIQTIIHAMENCEQIVSGFRCSFPKWSQEYEAAVYRFQAALELSTDPKFRDQISTLHMLQHYSQVLNMYMDLTCDAAISLLESYTGLLADDNQATPIELELKKNFHELLLSLKHLDLVENPLLNTVKEKLIDVFSNNPNSTGILFVRTKNHALSLFCWIENLTELQCYGIKPQPLIGVEHSGDACVEQKIIESFRERICNLLIATTVAEEGLDVPACNLVIRIQHISSDIAKVRTQGRAKAVENEGITIFSSDFKKTFQELRNDELLQLVEKFLQWLPKGSHLVEEIEKRQKVLLTHYLQKMAIRKQLVSKQNPTNFQLRCHRCKMLACCGSDIYVIDSTMHHTVPGEEFKKMIVKRPHDMPSILTKQMVKTHKIYCASCDNRWGIIATWLGERKEFPVLNCSSFIFETNNKPRSVRKWFDVPFEVPYLSVWLDIHNEIEQTNTDMDPEEKLDEETVGLAHHSNGDQMDVNIEEQKHIAAVQKAMEGGYIDHTIIHGAFVGPARSGKNSLMERLLGQMPSAVSPSTGVADSVVQVKMIQKSNTIATNVEKLIWSVMDYDDDVIKLMLISKDSKIKTIPDKHQDVQDYVYSSFKPMLTNMADSDSTNDTTSQSNISSDGLRPLGNNIEYTEEQDEEQLLHLQKNVQYSVSPIVILKQALKSKGLQALQQHFEKSWSLYLTNTGGQIEFQEVLPLLVSGPAIFFFTFRLDRDLNELYTIEYEHFDGKRCNPYKSTLSTMEGILQTLASISAMGTFVYQGLQKRLSPLRPKVFFVGTHKDKLDNQHAQAYITQIDKKLQEAIKLTSHYHELVEFASDSQLMFAVNNFSETDADFNIIRSAVERIVTRDEFRMSCPVHWLIFSIAVRKLPAIVDYDICFEVAKQCGIANKEEFSEALHFIHSKMGLIRYFPYDDIKDLVIVHPQILFDIVTTLIVDTFVFEKASKQKSEEFKKKGIFSISEFDQINEITCRNSKGINERISSFKFGKLLDSLRIAAPFKMKDEMYYFFPCVLPHANESDNDQGYRTPVPSLLVSFSCGYCPKGVSGALIKYLITNEMKSSSWILLTDQIFKNQVSFCVGPYDTIVIRIMPTYLEISCIPDPQFDDRKDHPVEKTCTTVCKDICSGIQQILTDLNYIKIKHSLTFPCQAMGCNISHSAQLLLSSDGSPSCLLCNIVNKRSKLPSGSHLWCLKQIFTKSQQHQRIQVSKLQCEQLPVLLYQLNNHSAKWREIGLFMGFFASELDNIQAKPFLLQGAPLSWFGAMLEEWLQWAPEDRRGSTSFATLEALKAALVKTGLGAVAHELHI